MKIVSSILISLLAAAAAAAQGSAPRVVATVAAGETVKNAPFSADAVSDSVQTLADGNRIVRNSTTKIYRNSEGRIRRELDKSSGSGFSTFFSTEPGITIMDPAGSRYLLDSRAKIATAISPLPLRELNIVSAAKLSEEQKAAIGKLKDLKVVDAKNLTAEQKAAIEKFRAEVKAFPRTPLPSTAVVSATGVAPTVGFGTGGSFAYSVGTESRYDTKSEDLGTRDFDGVQAEGTRRVTTIPAGAIGNERPIETVYERWYSKELGMVVMSKHIDPRFGEQTYRLTNIVRAEPDPSLFSVPTGYRVVTDAGSGTYYRSTPKVDAERGAARGTTVYTTKP